MILERQRNAMLRLHGNVCSTANKLKKRKKKKKKKKKKKGSIVEHTWKYTVESQTNFLFTSRHRPF